MWLLLLVYLYLLHNMFVSFKAPYMTFAKLVVNGMPSSLIFFCLANIPCLQLITLYFLNTITVISIYVEDLVLITSTDSEEITDITTTLNLHFKIKNLGNFTYFLGLEVACNNTGLHLNHRKYTLDLLHETNMLDSTPMPTLMTHSSRFSSEQGTKLNAKATS